MLTPVAAYLKVAAESEYSFLLESVVGGENLARYSFVGTGQSNAPPKLCKAFRVPWDADGGNRSIKDDPNRRWC